MFFSGVQLFSSALGWIATNALGCTQVNIKEPEVTTIKEDSDPSIATFDKPVPVQLFQDCVYYSLKLLGDEVTWDTFKTCRVLNGSAAYECYEFALNFFTLQFIKDPTLIEDEKRWPILFSKIEGIVSQAFNEVVVCSKDVGIGYCVMAGMPISQIKEELPIPFMKISESVDPKEGREYTARLYKVAYERMINFSSMKYCNDEILKNIAMTGTFYQVPTRAVEFVQKKY